MFYNFEEIYNEYNLTKSEIDFFEWCRIKFNIEALGPCSIKDYGNFAKAIGIKELTYKKGREEQIDRLRSLADIEVNKRTYTIKDVFHTEQQEFLKTGRSPHGSYETAYRLLSDNWWNQRNSNDYFASTEEIAIEMGLLKIPYQNLERAYGEQKINRLIERDQYNEESYNVLNLERIQKIDWERRAEALIITQLKSMMVDRKNNRNYSISETLVYKSVSVKIIDGLETRVIEYKGEVPDTERKVIYAKINSIQQDKTAMLAEMKEKNQTPSIHQVKSNPVLAAYYSELRSRGIYPAWKIIATPHTRFKPLREDFKEFLVKILINNKQNKVHRGLSQMEYNQRGIDIDGNDNIAFEFREDLYLVELILDGESLYKEIKNDDGSIDYVRLVCGRQIQKIRDEISEKDKNRPKF